MSRPVRARGLKLNTAETIVAGVLVAPRAGAWIETSYIEVLRAGDFVAPRAGAWIETLQGSAATPAQSESRPVRARGLKQFRPCRGVALPWSRPVRARGLKQPLVGQLDGRGKVAPRAGAWIETGHVPSCGQWRACRAPCGRVD